jgi:hypothetical protein
MSKRPAGKIPTSALLPLTRTPHRDQGRAYSTPAPTAVPPSTARLTAPQAAARAAQSTARQHRGKGAK